MQQMKNGTMAVSAVIALVIMMSAQAALSEIRTMKLDWSDPGIRITRNHSEFTPETFDDRDALRVNFSHVEWPHIMFRPREGVWNWAEWEILDIEIYNPGDEQVPVGVRVDNEGAPSHVHCLAVNDIARPGEWTRIRVPFRTDVSPLWGMRGLPESGAVPTGSLDPSQVTAFQVYLPRPTDARQIYISGIRLVRGEEYSSPVELPFMNEFGQYKHQDWPGKIESLEDMHAAREQEAAALADAPLTPNQDEMGGWIDGPQLEATGWFRTELVDGKWWLVTPEGRLFLSLGITCVAPWDPTFVEGREEWFDWLPDRDDPDFGGFYAEQGGAHSMAEPIDGHGLTFPFYAANLRRKYGPDWNEKWREMSYKRLRAWGFNTIAAWAQQDVFDNSPMPFTAIANATSGARPIAAGQGYWSRMADVFDPEFPEVAERNIAPTAQRYADNPLCIGFYIDNELGWGDIRAHTLASPTDQPARQFLIEMLQEKYPSIEVLNAAWGTNAESWDTLDRPAQETRAARADLDDYVYAFSERYFQTVSEILRRHAPNHLYLGSRFAGPPEEAAFRACAENVDVISLNLYFVSIDPEDWNLERTYGKPAMIGEFHFGALDRGMFHTGLGPAADQADRATKYANYVHSIASNPAFIGSHWFQYVDSPVTGRWMDGENYNIGFVSVTDTPYPELVEAATEIHKKVYDIRSATE